MEAGRTLTLYFIDGTKMSFDFPEQSKGMAGKQLRLDSFRDSNHVLIEADGNLLMFPMANIKYLQLTLSGPLPVDEARPPRDLIRGATISG
jgi:hypothetical protein